VNGRFRIEKYLGSGATAQVYEAVDVRLERRVALKILDEGLLHHPTALTRMEREAKALARVRHPNVIDIFDVDEYHGRKILALELAPLGTLATRIRAEGAQSVERAVTIMTQLLGGLAAIHGVGLVHRDMKPSNILITESGAVKIADLGIALEEEGTLITRTGARLGTPEYMSPEQIRGPKVDKRTDIYACGIILYELLVGQVPFKADSEFEVFDAHVRVKPDMGRLPPSVPERIRSALSRALEKDPEDRWPGARAFADALGVNGGAIQVPPPPSHGPSRSRGAVTAVGAILLLGIGGGALAISGIMGGAPDPPPAARSLELGQTTSDLKAAVKRMEEEKIEQRRRACKHLTDVNAKNVMVTRPVTRELRSALEKQHKDSSFQEHRRGTSISNIHPKKDSGLVCGGPDNSCIPCEFVDPSP
jgi:serine/threonine-protein kinase